MNLRTIGIAFSVLILTAAPSFATSVSLNIDGFGANVTATSITFDCTSGITCGPGQGAFAVDPSSTIPPVPPTGTKGLITQMTEGTTPVGGSFSVPKWLTVANISLDLTSNEPGAASQLPKGTTVGTNDCTTKKAYNLQLCTPAFPALATPSNPMGFSNFLLENIVIGSHVTHQASFVVDGTATIGTARYLFVGTLSSPIAVAGGFQTQLATIAKGGTIMNAYSGSFTLTPIPEPSFLGVLGGAAILMGFALYRKRRYQRQ